MYLQTGASPSGCQDNVTQEQPANAARIILYSPISNPATNFPHPQEKTRYNSATFFVPSRSNLPSTVPPVNTLLRSRRVTYHHGYGESYQGTEYGVWRMILWAQAWLAKVRSNLGVIIPLPHVRVKGTCVKFGRQFGTKSPGSV